MLRNIWAIGRNYADHAKEMGASQPLSEPMIFLKAGSTAVRNGGEIHLPDWSKEIHHEVEIAYRLGADLKPDAFTLALDLTARDLQTKLKNAGHPWSLAKSFRDSCPLGDWAPMHPAGQHLEFFLEVNGQRRQQGSTAQMIFSLAQICEYLQPRFPLCEGDVILTGTPAGVAQMFAGDELYAEIKGAQAARWKVAAS